MRAYLEGHGLVDRLALEPGGGVRGGSDSAAAAEGAELDVLDNAVVADLDLQLHDVTARGGADQACEGARREAKGKWGRECAGFGEAESEAGLTNLNTNIDGESNDGRKIYPFWQLKTSSKMTDSRTSADTRVVLVEGADVLRLLVMLDDIRVVAAARSGDQGSHNARTHDARNSRAKHRGAKLLMNLRKHYRNRS